MLLSGLDNNFINKCSFNVLTQLSCDKTIRKFAISKLCIVTVSEKLTAIYTNFHLRSDC